MTIREARKDDAGKVIDLLRKLDSETTFMLFEPGERSTDLADQEKQIERFSESENRIMLLAESGHEVVAASFGYGGQVNRNKHVAHVVLGVAKRHWRKGIGARLMQEIEDWAAKRDFHKLSLTVMEHNQAARNLYRRLGYIEEGLKRDSLKVGNQYVNEICMGKLLGDQP